MKAANESALKPLLSADDLNLIRQWFDWVQDVLPLYLEAEDYLLAARIYEALDYRGPYPVRDGYR